MHSSRTCFAAGVAALFLVSACDRPLPTAAVDSPAFSAAGNGPPVSGGGRYTHYYTGETSVSVHATVGKDGVVSGQFEQHNPVLGLNVHGRVTCVVVDGNRALISGLFSNVKRGTLSGVEEGNGFILVVEDNGQGAQSPPDRVSPYQQGGPHFADCALITANAAAITAILLGDAVPLTSGNFHVRP
jgi:hypothetical protein